MSNPSFVVCIDESGDQGFSFRCQDASPEWFVVSAVVVPVWKVKELQVELLKLKAAIGCKPRKPIHFRKLKKANDREEVNHRLAELGRLFRAVVVMVHKPSLQNVEAFTESNRLYFYAVRYVLERASWFCASTKEYKQREHGDGTAEVLFSGLPELSKDKIVDYFTRLKSMETSIEWAIIRSDQFETSKPGRHPGLQVADCIASAFFCAEHAVSAQKTHRYTHLLKPVIYRSKKGKYRGYGLKLVPAEIEKKTAQGLLCPWASHFPS